ncbi:hypothetical protein TUM3794_20390 [Shewanella colwelliana]|uniref:Uncharacterized protein n=1 Tax=Shewanella colwelliana TaxID=23 RepID=A0ABQ4P0L4_SHECO|nr:hypothetical protein [Shewanella colwelliana]GIU41012.1 hypothetical protein TUM3794_20390 [Shewanella colwelliana]
MNFGRNSKFSYLEFVKKVSSTLKPGEVISPKCVRQTKCFGNSDSYDVAAKKLREAFDSMLGNSKNWKRKRSSSGGYEYLRL